MATSAMGSSSASDDTATICAISIVAFMIGDCLHEGVGHALLALLTGAQTGVISTVAWSSAFDSRLVAAGGTLVNLAAGFLFWLSLRGSRNSSPSTRVFLLLSAAFNLFTGTGYFFFSGVTNFGDWETVIAPMHPHWLWRILLVIVGAAAYYGAVLLIGTAIVRYLGIPVTDRNRFREITFLPYFSAIVISVAGAIPNPIGIQLLWESALSATAGANCGLLWLRYYIPSKTVPQSSLQLITRSYAWILTATICAIIFVAVLGRGVTLHH